MKQRVFFRLKRSARSMMRGALICVLVCFPLWAHAQTVCSVPPAAPDIVSSRNYASFTGFLRTESPFLKVSIAGTVRAQDGETLYEYPVYVARAAHDLAENNADAAGIKKVLFICGMHGNEPAPVFAMRSFLRRIQDGSYVLPQGIELTVLFIANPFGFERNWRYCSNGTDPNRDLRALSTQEMQILTAAAANETYDMVIDFHEAAADGTFVYSYSRSGKKDARRLLSYLEENGVQLENEYVDVVLRAKKGLIHSTWYAQLYLRAKNTITTGIYFHSLGVPFVLTMETPKRADFSERCAVITRSAEWFLSR